MEKVMFFSALAMMLIPITLAILSELACLRGTEPVEVKVIPGVGRVHVYVQNIKPWGKRKILAYSLWMPFFQCIVLDAVALMRMTPIERKYLFAHEVGHLVHGHPRRNFWWVASAGVFSEMRPSTDQRDEDEADDFAEKATGLDRGSFYK